MQYKSVNRANQSGRAGERKSGAIG